MAPFIRLLSLSTNGVLHLIGMKSESLEEEVSEEEIKSLLENGQDMIALDIAKFSDEYLDAILKSKRSRIPVYEKNVDSIIGILSVKDYIIRARETNFSDTDIRSLLQQPYFVPENQKIDKLFRDMQTKQLRMAILIDEYGGVSGLVTLEDLIEEIVR